MTKYFFSGIAVNLEENESMAIIKEHSPTTGPTFIQMSRFTQNCLTSFNSNVDCSLYVE